MDKIWFMGDVHAEKSPIEKFLNSDASTLIQLGDFGFIWKNFDIGHNKFLKSIEANYPNKTIIVILGNHENYSEIESHCPIVSMPYGGRAYQICSNIFAPLRGEVFQIGELKFCSLGGADSIDWQLRQPYKSWWPQEAIRDTDITKALHNIEQADGVDYMLTHTPPNYCIRKWFTNLWSGDISSIKLDHIVESENGWYLNWYCGHLHQSLDYTDALERYYRALDINEIVEIEA